MAETNNRQAHKPKKREKWGKPNEPIPFSIKDEYGRRRFRSRMRQPSSNDRNNVGKKKNKSMK